MLSDELIAGLPDERGATLPDERGATLPDERGAGLPDERGTPNSSATSHILMRSSIKPFMSSSDTVNPCFLLSVYVCSLHCVISKTFIIKIVF